MAARDLVNLGNESCEPVGALFSEVAIAYANDFEVLTDPAPLCGPDEAANDAELIEITTDHVFKTATPGLGFTRISGIEETGELTYTMIGETGNRLFQNELSIQIAGSSAAILAFCRKVKNARVIVLATEFGSGNVRQIGSKFYPARFSVIEGSLEAPAEGSNRVSLTLQDKSKYPAAIYKGVITYKE